MSLQSKVRPVATLRWVASFNKHLSLRRFVSTGITCHQSECRPSARKVTYGALPCQTNMINRTFSRKTLSRSGERVVGTFSVLCLLPWKYIIKTYQMA